MLTSLSDLCTWLVKCPVGFPQVSWASNPRRTKYHNKKGDVKSRFQISPNFGIFRYCQRIPYAKDSSFSLRSQKHLRGDEFLALISKKGGQGGSFPVPSLLRPTLVARRVA